MKPCKCGCGVMVKRDYKSGHNSRGKGNPMYGVRLCGEANGNYGKKMSLENRRKMSEFAKSRIGDKNPFYGKKHSSETRLMMRGENNGSWKGDNVTYKALHLWIHYNLPKTDLCEFCRVRSPEEAACVTKIYNRDFNNWRWLCIKCHRIHDKNMRHTNLSASRT